jgi:hypothetical protein
LALDVQQRTSQHGTGWHHSDAEAGYGCLVPPLLAAAKNGRITEWRVEQEHHEQSTKHNERRSQDSEKQDHLLAKDYFLACDDQAE